MGTKRCAYKNCGAFTSPTHPSADTFYSFPKDPARAILWMKLGGCPELVPLQKRYYCSKHFDETKYVASNPRRKQLLSTAVPWPCRNSPEKEFKFSEDADYQCVVSTMVDTENDDGENRVGDDFDEDVSVEVGNEISDTIEEALQNYDYHEVNADSEFTVFTEKKSLKRKLEPLTRQFTSASTANHPGPSSHNIVSNRATSSTFVVENIDYESGPKETDDFDESNLLESRNLTTFIFKGEEYIQMPKDDYITEKMILMQKIKAYEEILKTVKHLVEVAKI